MSATDRLRDAFFTGFFPKGQTSGPFSPAFFSIFFTSSFQHTLLSLSAFLLSVESAEHRKPKEQSQIVLRGNYLC
jgi:hypothetical protein